MERLLVAVAVAALAPGAGWSIARAQTGTEPLTPIIITASPSESAARAAMMQTPFGAVPPLPTSTIVGEVQRSASFTLQYGYIGGDNEFSFNNGALTATFPLAIGSTVSLTGGVLGCNGCGTGWMGGLGADFRIHEWPFRPTAGAARVLLSVSGALGYGWSSRTALSDGSVYSAALSLPISFPSSSRPRDMWAFVPFLSPGLGFGSVSSERVVRTLPNSEIRITDESANGTRFVIGGGLAVYRRGSNVMMNFGAQYIATQFNNIMAGVGVGYGW